MSNGIQEWTMAQKPSSELAAVILEPRAAAVRPKS